MKTVPLPTQADAKSPAGGDIRFLIDGETGNMIHSTVPPHQINKATVHATVHEFWCDRGRFFDTLIGMNEINSYSILILKIRKKEVNYGKSIYAL